MVIEILFIYRKIANINSVMRYFVFWINIFRIFFLFIYIYLYYFTLIIILYYFKSLLYYFNQKFYSVHCWVYFENF